MRIGYAQLNTTVGDLEGNLALAIDAYEQLCGQGIDIVVFTELFLCGYPPKDLLTKEKYSGVPRYVFKTDFSNPFISRLLAIKSSEK